MFKKGLLILLTLGLLPAFAGDVENAINQGKKVFLYLYAPDCKYCVNFNPVYNKISKNNGGNYAFFKINTSTRYGYELMRKYRGSFVPYVVLIDKNKAVQILPNCLLDSACVEREIKNF